MLLYSIIMFLTAAVFAVLCVSIGKGNTNLIHDYHQAKVKDKIAYGRAFAKALAMFPASMVLSGVLALVYEPAWTSIVVLVIGFVVGLICIVCVQGKYNRGSF